MQPRIVLSEAELAQGAPDLAGFAAVVARVFVQIGFQDVFVERRFVGEGDTWYFHMFLLSAPNLRPAAETWLRIRQVSISAKSQFERRI